MDLELFHAEFLNSVHLRLASGGGFSDDAFAEVAAEYLEDANEISNFEPCHYRSSNGRMAIDGYSFDDADDSLRVFIVFRSGSESLNTLTKTDAEGQFRKLISFVEAAFSGKFERSVDDNHPARDFAERVFEEKAKLYSSSRLRALRLPSEHAGKGLA